MSMKQRGVTCVNLFWHLWRKEVELIFFPFTVSGVFLKYDGFMNMLNMSFLFLSYFCAPHLQAQWLNNEPCGVTGKFHNLPAVMVCLVLLFSHLRILLA